MSERPEIIEIGDTAGRAAPAAAGAVDVQIGPDRRTVKVYLLDKKLNLQEATVTVGVTTTVEDLTSQLLAFARTNGGFPKPAARQKGVLFVRISPDVRVESLPGQDGDEVLLLAADSLKDLLRRGLLG